MTVPGVQSPTGESHSGPAKNSGSVANVPKNRLDIIDIRRNLVELSLKEEILSSLQPRNGLKTLPTLLLYDSQGLQIFEDITYLDEYYLTNAEINALERSAGAIAEAIPSHSIIVELGSGNLRKISILLNALDSAGKQVDYYALDLSFTELERTLDQVPPLKHVRCHGLHGTYDDGLDWLKLPENVSQPKSVMSLGSSLGNFSRSDACMFLQSFASFLHSSDSMIIGLDATYDPMKIYQAYNDQKGVTHRFILNGLLHANSILGEEVFKLADWKVIGEYVCDDQGGRHQAFLSPIRNTTVKDVLIKAGERIKVEQSLKYSHSESIELWNKAGLVEVGQWSASSDDYNIHLLKKGIMSFSSDPSVYAASITPSLEEWRGLWAIWDTVTRDMLPDEELLDKPIKLRNACIFYLGHIPTFLDIQLTKCSDMGPCEPAYFPRIFERGIDPDVDNPENCHDHSEIPDEWPPLKEILTYQDNVREKVKKLCEMKSLSRSIARALWIGFEHEVMHLETLLYMLLQSDKTKPPTKLSPDFEGAAKFSAAARVPNEWFYIPANSISVGLDDPEDNSGPASHFGWDCEKPSRQVNIPAFSAQGRSITNEEYAKYLQANQINQIPASWAENHRNGSYSNGYLSENTDDVMLIRFIEGKFVRTVYGLVPLRYALDWPVFASYDELSACAKYMGGRIPTFEEARSIYDYAETLKLEAQKYMTNNVPAVNGHLVNDGVEETPPLKTAQNGGSSQELFTNLDGANVGFKNWHPTPVTANGNKLAGQSQMGGVWEWTSSVLTKHEGFEPMPLYPAYTADFFDGKHNIVLGGSWATHPRIAGRRSFVNWYQRNYPYAWAGARLVRDL